MRDRSKNIRLDRLAVVIVGPRIAHRGDENMENSTRTPKIAQVCSRPNHGRPSLHVSPVLSANLE